MIDEKTIRLGHQVTVNILGEEACGGRLQDGQQVTIAAIVTSDPEEVDSETYYMVTSEHGRDNGYYTADELDSDDWN